MYFTTATILSLLSSATAVTYKSTFTQYGEGDVRSSPNCNTATAACGFYNYPGFNAAASQNLFGAGDGQGAGPGCGTCWQLTPEFFDDGTTAITGAHSVIVQINNLCPADSNVLCAQEDLSGNSLNQYGAVVNFDLCIDDGAAAQLFGSSATGLAIGSATQVSCSEWSGSAPLTSGSNPATGPPAPAPAPAPPATSAAPVVPEPTTLKTAVVSLTPAPVAGTQTLFGQCGGVGWAGATNCVSTATCSTQNQWYAQCTPTPA
ncbi:hypothetical protein MMC13_001622 [Lambiella insularis]|nr:hypothetical protein [Lambiella insularis]